MIVTLIFIHFYFQLEKLGHLWSRKNRKNRNAWKSFICKHRQIIAKKIIRWAVWERMDDIAIERWMVLVDVTYCVVDGATTLIK